MGQRRVVVLASWLAVIVACLAAFAAVTSGIARTVWLALLAAVLAAAVAAVLWELAPHRLLPEGIGKYQRRLRRKRETKAERDWRADFWDRDASRLLVLLPPGPATFGSLLDREAAGITFQADVAVTNQAGTFRGTASRHGLWEVAVEFPTELAGPNGEACPLAGVHRVSWTSSEFEGSRTMTVTIAA